MTEPTGRLQRRVEGPVSDPLELAADAPLTDEEAGYVEAARAANTLRGYRSDWAEFTGWCGAHGLDPLPPAPGTVTGYLTELVRAGGGPAGRGAAAVRAHPRQLPADPQPRAPGHADQPRQPRQRLPGGGPAGRVAAAVRARPCRRRRILGTEHPDTLVIRNNVAVAAFGGGS